MPRRLEYEVGAEELPATLGLYLRRRGYPQGLLASLRAQDGVRVNGAFRRMIDPLAAGDQVVVLLADVGAALTPNPALRLTLLYEDQDLLVIDKPADMLIHPAGLGFDDSIGNFCAARYPELSFRPIGRLDRNTTGACLVAKHQLAAACLSGQVDKDYYAFAEGWLEADAGLIDAPLERIGGPQIRRQVGPAGQPSRTRFQVLRRLEGLTFLRLQLLTGRTHQIRAHLQYLGHPLAGDSLYGGSTRLINRQALHCGELRFSHPVSGRAQRVLSPLPPEMAALLKEE